jgi:peptidoglycan hydrolase-like protein with peptidoglycan-binding domain
MGDSVVKLQRELTTQGYPCADEQGFGDLTEGCVIQFQSDQNLVADGKVGPLTWEKLFKEIPTNEPSVNTVAVLKTIKSRTDIYHQPTFQDNEGRGIWPTDGVDGRSERVYPAFVLGPRRQVDSLVRQMYSLLPTQDTAFIITDRLVQYPEEYLPYIAGSQNVVFIGSFGGIGLGTSYPDWAIERHKRELWQLEQSIRLAQAMQKNISLIVIAMGDSPNTQAVTVRTQLQGKLDTLLNQYNLSHLIKPITWGADEAVLMAFAQTLPNTKVLVRISNPDCHHHYEGGENGSTSKEILDKKLTTVGLTKVNPAWEFDTDFVTNNTNWDFEVAILTRRQGGSIHDYQTNDQQQAQLDTTFLNRYSQYSAQQRSKLAIIDGRLFNGAWDARSVLPYCDLLAFGSWGTMGNVIGATLAIAKILFHAKNSIAQRQLYLEAVAHDVFANGYKEAQRGALKQQVQEHFAFAHNGQLSINPDIFYDEQQIAKVFKILNELVNRRMQEYFTESDCLEGRSFHFTPQLWRTFESEIHIWPRLPEEVYQVGIYRTDLNALAFDPSSIGQLA